MTNGRDVLTRDEAEQRAAQIDGVSYDIDVSLASAGGALDLHPFDNGFLVSAGVFWNGNGADFNATPTSAISM